MLQIRLLATSIASEYNGRCIQHLPLGDGIPCAVVLLFRDCKNACNFSQNIISRWESLLTNPDINFKVTNILKENGHIKSIVASLHPNHLPILQCVIAKGKSWLSPSGYGIIGPAISEALAVAKYTSYDNNNDNKKKRQIHTRDRPKERVDYICCESVIADVTHSKWWKLKSRQNRAPTYAQKEHYKLQEFGVSSYYILNVNNSILINSNGQNIGIHNSNEICENMREQFEKAIKEGYGRTLHSTMNLFDVPDFLSMLSVRSCIRTKLTAHTLDNKIINKYRAHKTVLVCILKNYSEPWFGKKQITSNLAKDDGEATSLGSYSYQERLKRHRMNNNRNKQQIGRRGLFLKGTCVESINLGGINYDNDDHNKHLGINMEYFRNLQLFKNLFRHVCEEVKVEIYDKLPIPIGIAICESPITACDMASRLMDRIVLLRREHQPGNVKTIDGPLIGELNFGIACGDMYDLDNEDIIGVPLDRARCICEENANNDIVIDESCMHEYEREINSTFHINQIEKTVYRLLRHT
jgi:hypothetical protein